VVVLQRRKRKRQFSSPSLMALLQKMKMVTIITFFGDFVAKKVIVAMSSPSFMVVVL
jgi:hypothetical protein